MMNTLSVQLGTLPVICFLASTVSTMPAFSTNPSRREFLSLSVGGLVASSSNLLSGIPAFGRQDLPETSRSAEGTKWAAATVHPFATDIAAAILKQGGNAIDAAVAASFMLSVVDGHNSGIGGGCFALVRTATGRIHAIDGREMAPSQISAKNYYRDGKPDPSLSQTGPLAVGVPGQVAALWKLSQEFGSLDWAQLVRPAAEVARQGFAFGTLANVVRRVDSQLSRFPETARILKPNGKLPSAGDTLLQVDLANTLEKIARGGADAFYLGDIAEKIATHLQQHGGMLTRQDMANYRIRERTPIESFYRGNRVIGFSPPSSGGLHISQMLTMLEPFDLKTLYQQQPADYYHLIAEVMKRAMSDRAHWLGDADYAKVPAGLLNVDYLKQRMEDFQFDRVTDQLEHGLPPGAESQFLGDRHTTHLTTADGDGNIVAMTQTVNTSFGSKMIAPGTGVVLNNEMDDFAIAPGVRNAFGLVGTDANAIEPGKRPLSSMSPTIVLDRNGNPVVTCGAAGGPRIITATLLNTIGVLDLELNIADAIAAPRVHHQWSPNTLYLEEAIAPQIRTALEAKGHKISVIEASAVAQGISFKPGKLRSASDPRTHGKASAF